MKKTVHWMHSYELKVGFLILVGILFLAGMILSIGKHQGMFRKRYELRVLMDRVSGLQVGAPVRLAGLGVGKVISIEFPKGMEEKQVEITLKIDQKIQQRIRKDSVAHIGTLGLLGDKFVNITLGSFDQPVLQPGDYLQGSTPIDIEEIIEEGVKVLEDLKAISKTSREIAEKINRGEGTIGMMVNDPTIYFKLDEILALTRRLAVKIESGEGTVAKLFNDPEIYKNLNRLLVSVGSLSDNLQKGEGTLGKMVRDTTLYTNLTGLVGMISSISERIERGQGTAGKLAKDEELYQDLRRTIGDLDELIRDIKKNPRRYFKLKIF